MRPLISVVIPCFNHGRFLADAVTSVMRQTYAPVEVIVIDDGSTDDTASVCNGFRDLVYVHQENAGLPASRNVGLARTRGECVAFLDADDRLLPEALEIGDAHLRRHPECVFVSGDHRYIDVDGTVTQEWTRRPVTGDHYAALLRSNYIGMGAAVLYRRQALAAIGGFDTRLAACEDYDVYLRLARQFPVCDHTQVIAEYRRYGCAMSDDPERMLEAATTVLRSQKTATRGNRRYAQAYAQGMRYWQRYYGRQLAKRARAHWARPGGRGRALRELLLIARKAPAAVPAIFLATAENRLRAFADQQRDVD